MRPKLHLTSRQRRWRRRWEHMPVAAIPFLQLAEERRDQAEEKPWVRNQYRADMRSLSLEACFWLKRYGWWPRRTAT